MMNRTSYRPSGRLSVFSILVLTSSSLLAHEGENHNPPKTGNPQVSRSELDALRGQLARPAAPPKQAPPPRQQPVAPSRPPHDGQVKVTWKHVLEVVYEPTKIRIYLADVEGRPLNPRGVTGDVVMEVRGNRRQWRYPVELAPPSDNGDPEHLVVRADVSRVRDGDMVVLFDLNNLPHSDERGIRFGQEFFLTKTSSAVTVAKFTDADRAAVRAQQICPVTKDGFDHGEPIKLLVNGTPLFVCCEACIEEVKKDPQHFISLVTAPPAIEQKTIREIETPIAVGASAKASNRETLPQTAQRPRIAVSRVTESDRAAIVRQRICPVTGETLGAHGDPLRVAIGQQIVYLCCEACVGKLQVDPAFYLAPPPPLNGGAGKSCPNCRAK